VLSLFLVILIMCYKEENRSKDRKQAYMHALMSGVESDERRGGNRIDDGEKERI
jgi:hypothetical protein